MQISSRFKIIIYWLALIVTLAAIGYLAWLNHNELEQAMVKQAQKQILITALAEAQSIGKYIKDDGIPAEDINKLVKHINDIEKVYAFIINGDAQIISYPYASYSGKNLPTLIKGKAPDPDQSKLNLIIQKIKNEQEGTDALYFFSEDSNPKIVRSLIGFAPLHINGKRESIVVVMEYDVVGNPIHKNAMVNIFFLGCISLVFIVFGAIFYKIHREKDKLEVTGITSHIINKQLRAEIEEYRKLHGKK